ncbi:hypothetical protein DFH07DRAFT_927754 [Mycena maculata]|uniref:Uncharacterized protein n=1 Tax=Mycena maculata TaxID=230809 RepID=A0AAD7I7G2_9AGAR|nr:hypothetical protein DFH07DRAFT_927754 [Mycena maculata]
MTRSASSSYFQLPRTLVRPSFTEVSRTALLAASPELGNVSVEFIRKNLLATSPQMISGTSALSQSHLPTALPKSSLPPYLTVPFFPPQDCGHPSYPTHALAISNASPSGPVDMHDMHLIFPIHALVLAAHCSKLPQLPPPAPRAAASVHLPVLPLALPSAPAFSILLAFMYAHRLDAVLSALFPVPPPFLRKLTHKTVRAALQSGADLHLLSAHLCTASGASVQVLMTHTAHVKELWQDMVALGIDDAALWDTVELAYEIVLGALNLAVMAPPK